ncbi:MAG: NUDIX hydrolase [Proteobacteria bacterium]|nr:NUDIX hydrolase [Pseudomonadota bacterium]
MMKHSPRPPYPYCPWCRGDLSSSDPHRQVCSSCGFILYHSSSPCMGAIPIDDQGRVLLARRGIEPFYGHWNTIGGFLGYQEEPLDGLKREVREETGVDCDILECITMVADQYGDGGGALMCSHFTVRLLSDDVKPQDDVSELAWFSLDSLPDNIPFTSDRRALAALRQRRSGKK